MCTVTFVKSGSKSIITSNRDEQESRAAAAPETHTINGLKITFPKDPKAGGTWYAVNERGGVAVLLNGAAERHQWNPPYRLSRGIVVLEIASSLSMFSRWREFDLLDIEPFTLIMFEDDALFQARWDGTRKELWELDTKKPHIWSSTMLYPKDVRDRRERWFRDLLSEKTSPDEVDMINFHRYAGADDIENGLVMAREGILKTVSITQSAVTPARLSMKHFDLVGGRDSAVSFSL